MPFNPKKCCGKNVIFTPVNITKKCIFSHLGLSVIPVNKGNQCAIPAKIPNTAPIDNT